MNPAVKALLASTKLPRLRFPTELEFEPVQLCNAKCFCCPYTWLQENKEYRGQKMSREQIESLLRDFGETMRRHGYDGETTINPFRYSDPLVCRDLDLVFALAAEYGLKVQITTNAVSFNDKYTELLERSIAVLKPWIWISVIGSTHEEVRELMAVDLDRTFSRLERLAAKISPLLPRIRISLRVVSGTAEEAANLEGLRERFEKIGVGDVVVKRNWLHNRIEGERARQSPERFVKGCGLSHNKLLRRMEVMVNGDVVLCDDDAEGRKIFGNVFRQPIEEIWNGPLLAEHRLIFDRSYSAAKQDLICGHCTRAVWHKRRHTALDSLRDIGGGALAGQFVRGNVGFV